MCNCVEGCARAGVSIGTCLSGAWAPRASHKPHAADTRHAACMWHPYKHGAHACMPHAATSPSHGSLQLLQPLRRKVYVPCMHACMGMLHAPLNATPTPIKRSPLQLLQPPRREALLAKTLHVCVLAVAACTPRSTPTTFKRNLNRTQSHPCSCCSHCALSSSRWSSSVFSAVSSCMKFERM